ncbi:MAG: metal-sensing transcriptional repressor [Coriobacteriales bacterium]
MAQRKTVDVEAAERGSASCGCEKYKATPRGEDLQRDLQTRLNRIIGQLNGVKAMIDDNRYCGDVLTQLAAVQSALKSVSTKVLQNHMETCVVEKIQGGQLEVVDELVKLWRTFT